MSHIDDLKKLKELLDMEAITQEEFDKKKADILREGNTSKSTNTNNISVNSNQASTNKSTQPYNQTTLKQKKHNGTILAVVTIVLFVIFLIVSCGSDSDNKGTVVDDISNFKYEITGNSVSLKEYKGKKKDLTIASTYKINGVDYTTDLMDFQVRKSCVKTIRFAEGITDMKVSIFNGCDVQNVYLPSTLTVMYDYTLSYLHPDDGKTVQVYTPLSEEEWSKIFASYKGESFTEKMAEGNGKAAGEALADKLNNAMGGFDPSKITIHYSYK